MTIYITKGNQRRRLTDGSSDTFTLIGKYLGAEVRYRTQIRPSHIRPDDELIFEFPDSQKENGYTILEQDEINFFAEHLKVDKAVATIGVIKRTEIDVTLTWEPTLPPGARK